MGRARWSGGCGGGVLLARGVGGNVNQSGLLRWIAEAVLFPPALLPSPHLAWQRSEEDPQRSARAVVRWRGTTTSATLTFDGEGRLLRLRSDDYWRVLPGGAVEQFPWVATATEHRRFE